MNIQHLICTVGTSLFSSNLAKLEARSGCNSLPSELHEVLSAWQQRKWPVLADALRKLPPSERLLGAEINSMQSLQDHGYVQDACGLTFLHSDTPEGEGTAAVLQEYYIGRGFTPVFIEKVEGLRDDEPRRFQTEGLRNLSRLICRKIREYGAAYCAINATGGYKAQIAIAVLIGQALSVPVYYMHERFAEVIAFPPMPVALDFTLWMTTSGILWRLSRDTQPQQTADFSEEWDERLESLVNRETIDGIEYLELSPVGQIFHETFVERFRRMAPELLPPRAARKKPPRWEAGGLRAHPEILSFMERLTAAADFVESCATVYFNPDLPSPTRFRLGSHGIEAVFSTGTWTVRIRVDTTAEGDIQRRAAVAWLNDWLNR